MGFQRIQKYLYYTCNQKEVKLMAQHYCNKDEYLKFLEDQFEVRSKKMSAYYAYNTSNGYKVGIRSWYKIFEHMIMNNAYAACMDTAVKAAGIQPNEIFGSVRNKKTTRRYMMENALNLTYRSGRWSSFWVDLQKNGYIHARDGYVDSYCKDWLNRTTRFKMARGKNGYYLTADGVRKFLKAYKTAKEDKLRAEERAMAKNNKNSNNV